MLLRLLGEPLLETDDGTKTLPPNRATLLAFYLACHRDWISRKRLSFFLRPEADELTARRYLRKVLNSAKSFAWLRDLEVEPQQLRWEVETDVSLFLKTTREGRWYEALELYRGTFLKGVAPANLPGYVDWIEGERTALAQLWLNANLNYAIDLEASGQHRDVVRIAETLLEADDLDEDALHLYLRNLYLSGQREQALKAGVDFYDKLGELGLGPTEVTQRLLEHIRNGQAPEKPDTTRRSGRRRSDYTSAAEQDAQIASLLTSPGSRIVSLAAVGDTLNVAFTRRIENPSLALNVVVDLAERLLYQNYTQRANDLLHMVLAQPTCDAELSRRILKLQKAYTEPNKVH